MKTEVWAYLFAIAEDQHGAFSTAQASTVGADSNMLARAVRAGLIDLIRPRVYVVRALMDDDTALAALVLACPRAVVSHRTAGIKHGFDGIETHAADVIVPPNVRLRGANVHRALDLVVPEIVVVDGFRCTDEIRTLSDLGAVAPRAVVERAAESLLRRRPDALSLLVARATALARKGKSGPQTLLDVLDHRPAVPTGSDLETVYWQCLRDHGVELPVRQHPVGPYLLDCAYPDERVFVELDGWGVHGTIDAFGRDRRRQNDVVLLGWVPLRFTSSDVHRYGRRTARITETTLRRRRALLVA